MLNPDLAPSAISRTVFRQILYRNISLPLLLGISSGAVFVGLILYLISATEWVDRSDQILAQAQRTEGLIVDAETGVRGYTITGRRQFLEPFTSATQQIAFELENLRQLVTASPIQKARVEVISRQLKAWREYANRATSLRATNGQAKQGLETRGKVFMDEIRGTFAELIQTEKNARVEKNQYTRKMTRVLMMIVIVVSGGFSLVLALQGRRQLTELSSAYENLLHNQECVHRALKSSEERLTMVIDAARIGTWDWDIRLGKVNWNTHHEILFGYEPGTPLRLMEDFEKRLDKSEMEKVREDIERALSTKSFYDAEYPIHLPDGSIRWAHGRGHGIYDKDGHPYRMMGTAIDVTARKETEKGLKMIREAGSVFSKSLDSMTTIRSICELVVPSLADWCMLDLINSDGVIDRVAVHHRDSSKQKIADCLKHYSPRAEIRSPVIAALQSGKIGFFDIKEEPKEESYRQIQLEQKHLAEQLGLNTAIVIPLIARDKTIGALSLISGESNRLMGARDIEVAQEIANRAAIAIDNSRLYAEAQRASQAKSRFLANMSHEIRTPIAVILGFTELALSSQLSRAELVKYFESIRRNGKALLQLIGDVLDLSKIEADKLEIERVNFNFPELMQDVVTSLNVQTEQKNVTLSLKVKGEIPRLVKSDPIRIRQVLTNVIGNAIKFTEVGRIDVEVTCTRGGDSQLDQIAIQVRDTGIGMDEQQQTALFRPFSQADNSTTKKFGGTGLGLVLSRRLSQALNGDLELVESKKGKGSTFLITLGVTVDDQRAVSGSPPPVEAELLDQKPLQGLRVLIVDDSIDNQIIVSRFLADAGAETETADNGEEGVNKAMGANHDVILMDIQMPILDGFEATKQLRSHNFAAPILALTANSLLSEKERALNGGFNDFLVKPFDRKQLIEKIRVTTSG